MRPADSGRCRRPLARHAAASSMRGLSRPTRCGRSISDLGRARGTHAATARDPHLGADNRRTPDHLDGRAPSARVGSTYVPRIFDWPVRRERPRRSNHSYEERRLRRGNGVPQSDQATLTEFFVRHGDHLTNVTVVTDPVFLSEPMVRSNDFSRQPVDPGAWLYACDDGEQILDRPKDYVPHYVFEAAPCASLPRATSCRLRRVCSVG